MTTLYSIAGRAWLTTDRNPAPAIAFAHPPRPANGDRPRHSTVTQITRAQASAMLRRARRLTTLHVTRDRRRPWRLPARARNSFHQF
jgi:hypothetical protein